MENQETYLTKLESKQLKIIKHYGLDNQLDQLVEESAELILSIRKYKRSTLKDPVGIINELSDVLNLIEQIKLSDEYLEVGINKIKEYKVNRELDRISKVE